MTLEGSPAAAGAPMQSMEELLLALLEQQGLLLRQQEQMQKRQTDMQASFELRMEQMTHLLASLSDTRPTPSLPVWVPRLSPSGLPTLAPPASPFLAPVSGPRPQGRCSEPGLAARPGGDQNQRWAGAEESASDSQTANEAGGMQPGLESEGRHLYNAGGGGDGRGVAGLGGMTFGARSAWQSLRGGMLRGALAAALTESAYGGVAAVTAAAAAAAPRSRQHSAAGGLLPGVSGVGDLATLHEHRSLSLASREADWRPEGSPLASATPASGGADAGEGASEAATHDSKEGSAPAALPPSMGEYVAPGPASACKDPDVCNGGEDSASGVIAPCFVAIHVASDGEASGGGGSSPPGAGMATGTAATPPPSGTLSGPSASSMRLPLSLSVGSAASPLPLGRTSGDPSGAAAAAHKDVSSAHATHTTVTSADVSVSAFAAASLLQLQEQPPSPLSAAASAGLAHGDQERHTTHLPAGGAESRSGGLPPRPAGPLWHSASFFARKRPGPSPLAGAPPPPAPASGGSAAARNAWVSTAAGAMAQKQQQQQRRRRQQAEFANLSRGSVLHQLADDRQQQGQYKQGASAQADFADDRAASAVSLKTQSDDVSPPDSCIAFTFRGRRYDPWRGFLALTWDIVDPSSKWRRRWDVGMLCLMIYVVIFTPYYIAFGISTAVLATPIAAIDLWVNCMFMTDVLVNFRTAYYDDYGQLVTGRKDITINYLMGWFIFDLVSSLPWDNILGQAGAAVTKALRLLRIVKILRLMQLAKVARQLYKPNVRHFLQDIDEALGKHVMRMIWLALTAFALVHWSACAFYYAAAVGQFTEDTWVYRQGLVPQDPDPSLYPLSPMAPPLPPGVNATGGGNATEWVGGASYATRYIYALYWSAVTMSTVGYGDITGVSIAERIVSVVVILIGASLFAYFLGSMTAIVAAFDSESTKQVAAKKAAVDEFLHHRRLPKVLSEKVSNFYNYTVARAVRNEEKDIISGLPMGLRMQVVLHLYREAWQALRDVEIFRELPEMFITTLVTLLKLEYYSPGDIVVRQGEVGHDMYFVSQGELAVCVYDEDLGRAETPAPLKQDLARSTFFSRGASSSAAAHRQRANKVSRVFLRQEDLEGKEKTDLGSLKPGKRGHFGICSCLMGEPRAATVLAQTYCELYTLSRHDLEMVVEKEWPELAEKLSMLVAKRLDTGLRVEDQAWKVRQEMGLPSREELYRYSTPVPASSSMFAAPHFSGSAPSQWPFAALVPSGSALLPPPRAPSHKPLLVAGTRFSGETDALPAPSSQHGVAAAASGAGMSRAGSEHAGSELAERGSGSGLDLGRGSKQGLGQGSRPGQVVGRGPGPGSGPGPGPTTWRPEV